MLWPGIDCKYRGSIKQRRISCRMRWASLNTASLTGTHPKAEYAPGPLHIKKRRGQAAGGCIAYFHGPTNAVRDGLATSLAVVCPMRLDRCVMQITNHRLPSQSPTTVLAAAYADLASDCKHRRCFPQANRHVQVMICCHIGLHSSLKHVSMQTAMQN